MSERCSVQEEWNQVLNDPIRGRPWTYRIQQNRLMVRYVTQCGYIAQKIATFEELTDLLGKLPDVNDREDILFYCHAMIEEDSIEIQKIELPNNSDLH